MVPNLLGAVVEKGGTSFRLYSEQATCVTLVLVTPDGSRTAHEMEQIGPHWSTHVPGIGPGQRYGFIVQGPDSIYHHTLPGGAAQLLLDPRSGAVELIHGEPVSIVVSPVPAWQGCVRYPIPSTQRALYELHIRGLTINHPDVPEAQRGTYLGITAPVIQSHLQRLRIGSCQFMPQHAGVTRQWIRDLGLANYWNYDPVVFMAFHQYYASRFDSVQALFEMQEAVQIEHAAGRSVIVDVVFGHTAEGGVENGVFTGTTICFRGIDRAVYYRIDLNGLEVNLTGCQNTLNINHPYVLELVLDSLRYLAMMIGIDGFRYDQAPILFRGPDGSFDSNSPFAQAVNADPILSQCQHAAEPCDAAGADWTHQGDFPYPWAEFNVSFRDNIRYFWRQPVLLHDFARCLAGSPHLFAWNGRRPHHSINPATGHDGMRLADVVTYNRKNNYPNGEHNQDGPPDDHSWNNVEEGVFHDSTHDGPTTDAQIADLRARQQRNILATTFLARGVPQLTAGDEIGQTQFGNNNPWNQDNATSHLNWEGADQELIAFTSCLAALRDTHEVLYRDEFLPTPTDPGPFDQDAQWIGMDGSPLATESLLQTGRSLGLLLSGRAIDHGGDNRSLLALFHGDSLDASWTLPDPGTGCVWEVLIDTAHPEEASLDVVEHASSTGRRIYTAGDELYMTARSVVVLRKSQLSSLD